jgi:hypothetical protein
METPMRSLILANQAGSGKTYTLFGYLFAMYQKIQRQMDETPTDGPFYPNLVIIPPTIIPQYIPEFLAAFDGLLELKVWYSSEGNLGHLEKYRHLFLGTSAKALEQYYSEVETSNPDNCRRVVLTSYQTLVARARAKNSRTNPADTNSDEAQDGNEEPPATGSKASGTQKDKDKAPEYTLPHLV